MNLFGFLKTKYSTEGTTMSDEDARLQKLKDAYMSSYMNQLNQAQNSGLIDGAASTAFGYYPQVMPPLKPNVVTITIEDASNGQIIRIGDVVRLARSDENLAEQIGAAYTEYKLKTETK